MKNVTKPLCKQRCNRNIRARHQTLTLRMNIIKGKGDKRVKRNLRNTKIGGVYTPNALSIRNFFLPLNPKIQTDHTLVFIPMYTGFLKRPRQK